jgi:uroporphyrinogen-III synthase
VTRVAVYRTLPAEPDEATLAELVRGVDVVTLASASAARSFASAAAGRDWPWLASATIACFGPVTAQAALACGLPVHIVAGESTADGLVEALQGYFQTTKDI